MAGFSVEVKDLDMIISRLDPERLHRSSLKGGSLAVAQAVADVVRAEAPRLTGALANSIVAESLGEVSAIVRVTARSYRKGKPANYRYPRRLNYDDRLRTAGWLSVRAKARAESMLASKLGGIAGEIERNFGG